MKRSSPRSPLGDGKLIINALMTLESVSKINVLIISLLDPIAIVKINNVIIDTEAAIKGPRPPANQTPDICILSATAMIENGI